VCSLDVTRAPVEFCVTVRYLAEDGTLRTAASTALLLLMTACGPSIRDDFRQTLGAVEKSPSELKMTMLFIGLSVLVKDEG
jgi:hypothetical protein